MAEPQLLLVHIHKRGPDLLLTLPLPDLQESIGRLGLRALLRVRLQGPILRFTTDGIEEVSGAQAVHTLPLRTLHLHLLPLNPSSNPGCPAPPTSLPQRPDSPASL